MNYTKHIVFVTPGFARDEADYLCTPYLQDFFQALQLAQPGLRISIIALQYPYRAGHYRWHGLDVYALGGHNWRLLKPWIWTRCRMLIKRLHAVQAIDVLHAFWLGETCRCALRAARVLKLPVVATAMGQDVLPANRYLHRLDLQAVRVIALSKFSERLLQKHAHREADAVIPFGIAPSDVDARALAVRPIDLLAVGSFTSAKRMGRFLRVVNQLRDQFPGLRAVLVGDGPEGPLLKAFMKAHGLEAHLELIPELPRVEILELMSRTKVFVHTSKVEGMGLVLAEALARGCHLVSTPVGVAEVGDKCLLAEDTFTLATHAAHFLQHPVDWEPRVPHPLEETVACHISLYGWD
jgi:1,2-diacylglycerol 3-alpha-glucosyltransferase